MVCHGAYHGWRLSSVLWPLLGPASLPCLLVIQPFSWQQESVNDELAIKRLFPLIYSQVWTSTSILVQYGTWSMTSKMPSPVLKTVDLSIKEVSYAGLNVLLQWRYFYYYACCPRSDLILRFNWFKIQRQLQLSWAGSFKCKSVFLLLEIVLFQWSHKMPRSYRGCETEMPSHYYAQWATPIPRETTAYAPTYDFLHIGTSVLGKTITTKGSRFSYCENKTRPHGWIHVEVFLGIWNQYTMSLSWFYTFQCTPSCWPWWCAIWLNSQRSKVAVCWSPVFDSSYPPVNVTSYFEHG